VIPRRELDDLRAEWSLDIGVIEKDYVLGWLLAGIAAHPDLAATWIFKGGTCLRKCYYETFRFSEDLDFTVVDAGPEEPPDLQRIFTDVGEWLQEEAGIELVLDDNAFWRRQNRRGCPTTQGRISYRGPNPTRGVLPGRAVPPMRPLRRRAPAPPS
jgi:Nucleotidyl transferase AbiEii toxin, Type IV TA system